MDSIILNTDKTGSRVRAMSEPTSRKESSRRMSSDLAKNDEGDLVSHTSNHNMENNEMRHTEVPPASGLVISSGNLAAYRNTRGQKAPAEPTLPPVKDIPEDSDIPRESLSNRDKFTKSHEYTTAFTPINDDRPTSTHNSQSSYVSPATYLGDNIRLIARRQSVPSLQISPPHPLEGSFVFQPREHKMTQKILQKTAKCDYCNQRNKSVLLKCQECPTAICRSCVERGKLDNDPTHRIRKEEQGSLDWDPDTGPRAAGFRSKRRVLDNKGKKGPGSIHDDASSRRSDRTRSVSKPPRDFFSGGGDANQDSDDEDWTPSAPSRKRVLPRQSSRPRSRPRRDSISVDDESEEEVYESSSKRSRRNSGAAPTTPTSESSRRSIALDEESATAASYRPVRQTALRALDRAYVGAQPEVTQTEASTRVRNTEYRLPSMKEHVSGQHQRMATHGTDHETRYTPPAHRDRSPPLPTHPPNARFIANPRPPTYLPSMEQRRNSPAELPPPAPVHPPVAPHRFAEPGAVPRGTFPRPQYGSTIPGTWQPPLWTSNGVDWDKQPGNLASSTNVDSEVRTHASDDPSPRYPTYTADHHAVENGSNGTLPPIRRAPPSQHGTGLPAATRPDQTPRSHQRHSILPPLHFPSTGSYSSTPAPSSRESTFTGYGPPRSDRSRGSAPNERDVLDAGATLAGMRSSIPPNGEARNGAEGRQQADKTTQTDDYLMNKDK